MCECASTSVTTIHPRHPPHHRYIIAVSVLDNAAHRLQKTLTSSPPLSSSATLLDKRGHREAAS